MLLSGRVLRQPYRERPRYPHANTIIIDRCRPLFLVLADSMHLRDGRVARYKPP